MKNIITNFNELDLFIKKYLNHDFEGKSEFEFLHSYKLDFNAFVEIYNTPPVLDCDPFSDVYANL